MNGIYIALLTAIPIMIIVYRQEKKALIPMTLFSIILGAGVGLAVPRTVYLNSKSVFDRVAGSVMAGLGVKLMYNAFDRQ